MKLLPLVARVLLGVILVVFGVIGALAPETDMGEDADAFILALKDTGYLWPLVKATEITSGLLLITGLFGIWSMHVFQDRPSAGFGATFFLISAGQMVGPPIGGYWADLFSLQSTFLITAILSASSAFLEPKKDLRTLLT